MSKITSVKIPEDLWEQISALAEKELRSRNNMINILLREAVKARTEDEK